MIYRYLHIIADTVKQSLPNLTKAIYLARIDDEGRVLVQSTDRQNEFIYAGLKDNDSDYFYIRHRDGGEIFFEEASDAKRLVCGHTKIVSKYELRLVACLKNWCAYNAEDSIRTALINADLPDIKDNVPVRMNITNAGIMPKKAIIDSISVLTEESPKPRQFDKNLIFIAIDFDLTFENNYF
jgi:hypothetical protein